MNEITMNEITVNDQKPSNLAELLAAAASTG